MSADVINAQEKPNVWVVHGVNWKVKVPLNEYNMQFDAETQALEAASQALWAFKGNDNGIFIVMDEGEEIPYLSTTLIVHLEGADPNKGFVPYTHEILANQGFYTEATKMQKLLEADLEAIAQKQIEEEDAMRKADEAIKNFKKDLKPIKENPEVS